MYQYIGRATSPAGSCQDNRCCSLERVAIFTAAGIAVAIDSQRREQSRPAAVMEWVNEAYVRANVPVVAGGVDTTRSCTYTIGVF